MISGLVSVIVVNWNRRTLLRNCLHSLRLQRDAPAEWIVIDNGSDDGSAEMAEDEFGCRVIRNRRNLGFCAANNQGIREARGEFIALLNNDAEAEPGWLSSLLRVFNDPVVGMAASKILVFADPRRIDKVGHLLFPDGQNRGRGTGQLDTGQFDRTEEVLWPDGCAAMYRKTMLDQIGGFDEDFFAYGDDAELGLRARIARWRCIYSPYAVVLHHRGATLGVRSFMRLKLIERNRVLLAVKLFPWSLLVWNVFYYVARLAAGMRASLGGIGEAGRFTGFRGRLELIRALLAGDLAALALVPRMLSKRRQIRKIRKLSPSAVRQLILSHQITLRELSTQAAYR